MASGSLRKLHFRVEWAAGFNEFVEKHNEGINTIGFWAIVGLSTILGGIAGGGVLSILTAPLFGFLGSLLYAGTVKAYGKITGQAIFPDTKRLLSSATDAVTDALGVGNRSYIKDGFWASYQRQMGQIWNCTVESIKGWFKPSKPSTIGDIFGGVGGDGDDSEKSANPAYTNQKNLKRKKSTLPKDMQSKYGVSPKKPKLKK